MSNSESNNDLSPQALPRRKKKQHGGDNATNSTNHSFDGAGDPSNVEPTHPELQSFKGNHSQNPVHVTSSDVKRCQGDDDVTGGFAEETAVARVPSKPLRRETVYTMELSVGEDQETAGGSCGLYRELPMALLAEWLKGN